MLLIVQLILFRTNMFPYVDNFTLFCHTWEKNISELSKFKLLPNDNQEGTILVFQNFFFLCFRYFICACLDLYVFVHNDGEFLQSHLRNGLENFQGLERFNMQVQISVEKVDSSPSFECMAKASFYDECVLKSTLKQLENKCIPPFMEINGKVKNHSVCKNRADSLEAFDIFQSLSRTCQQSCTQVHVGINKTPIDKLYTMINGLVTLNPIHGAYYVSIPHEIIVLQVQYNYLFISYIADFGGWIGLLLGLSTVGLWDFLVKILKVHDKVKLITRKVYLIIGSILILIIIVHCCLKMAYRETGSDIKIESYFKNLNLSLCSLENIYVKDFYESNYHLKYIGDNSNFWNDNTKLHNKIKKIEIGFKDGTKRNLYNSTAGNSSDLPPVHTINLPYGDTFIETCHTFDLNYDQEIHLIEITAKKEVVCYLHISGQLLFQDSRQGFGIITPENVKFTNVKDISVSSLSTFFDMKELDLHKVINNPYSQISSYDNCILACINEQSGVNISFLNPKEKTTFETGLQEKTLKRIENILSLKEYSCECESPVKRVHIKYQQEKLNKDFTVKRNMISDLDPSQGKSCN